MLKFLLAGAVFLIGAESFARLYLGLGTPPLSVAHRTIEYMFAPDQDVQRFGNRQLYNEFGMRSPPMAQVSASRRVLVMGDSVVNGGNLTDHAELATSLLSTEAVFYGNVSAGSWGPANLTAWLREYGSLGAQTAIVVLNSGDLYDLPTFEPLNPNTHPVRTPVLALEEVVLRYLPGFMSRLISSERQPARLALTEEQIAGGQAVLEDLLNGLVELGLSVCLIQHQTQTELQGQPEVGWHVIHEAFAARNFPVVQFAEWTGPARAIGPTPFTDDIHLSVEGQRLLAEAITACMTRLEG